MSCFPIHGAFGPCSTCGKPTDGLHWPDESGPVFCGGCCSGSHKCAESTHSHSLAIQIALETLAQLGVSIPKRTAGRKALAFCQQHADRLPDELRRLLESCPD